MPVLHPTLRLLLLFIIAITLPFAATFSLLVIQLCVALACALHAALGDCLRGLWRLKWLFVSIVILYGWFTPGLPVVEVVGVKMPTQTGLIEASTRLLLLSTLLATVIWCLKPLRPQQTAEAISALLRPLALIGVDVQRFGLRLALTLSAVSVMQERLKESTQGWLEGAGQTLLAVESGELVPDTVALEPLEPIPLWQLFVFLVLAAMLLVIAVVS